MDYEKLGGRDLRKLLRCNRPDVPHYQGVVRERKWGSEFWKLIVSCAVILTTVIASSFVHANTFASQASQESWQRLNTRNQQFENYKNDFRQFGQSSHARQSRDAEDMTDIQLMVVADQVTVHLECTETMIEIYLKVLAKKDRLEIWPLITERLDATRQRLDQQVGVINALVTGLKTPAVITEAMHMRDDLRGVEQDLDGTVKELEAAEAKLP
jgi:hypothetical protein